jgi:hypothetical protein
MAPRHQPCTLTSLLSPLAAARCTARRPSPQP